MTAHSQFACQAGKDPDQAHAEPRFRVWLADPWCRTPWYTGELTRALRKGGHAVRMVCPSYHLEPDYFRSQGLTPEPGLLDRASRMSSHNGGLSRAARFIEYAVNSAGLAAALPFRAPQIIHQQQCVLLERGSRAEIRFLQWARSRGARVVHTVHNLLPHQSRQFHRKLFGELYSMCDALVCHDSESATALTEQFQVTSSRVHVVPHGPLFAEPPNNTSSQCKEALGIRGERQVYLAMGVLAAYKGLDILLQSWAHFITSWNGSTRPLLLVAGNGPEAEKARLRSRVVELSVSDSVRLDLQYVPASQVPQYMHAADVLLYPYREITTSGALLTGLNYCKPIIASDLPAFRGYLFPDVNAKVVRAGCVEALTIALQETSGSDTLARLNAGSRSNAILQVQWDQIAIRTAQVYEAALG